MNIGVFVNTPAQVHFFRNMCFELKSRGHEVYILYRDYGETKDLIKEFNIPAFLYASPPTSKIGKLVQLPISVIIAARYLRDKKIDLVIGFGVYDAYTSFLLNVPCVVFTDTEPSLNNFTYAIQNRLYILFIDNIITPVFYKHDYGKKHVRVDSFKELAYLHPKYFHPNDDVFKYLGIDKSEAYILLRFNSFDAVHDTGLNGFTTEDKIRLIKELEKKARVFISSESAIPDQISSYRLNAPRSRIHDIIYFSKLLVADTGTMVTEAAILGVPSIMMHPKALVFGNFDELEKRYGLVHCYDEFSEDVIEKANDLVNGSMVKEEWEEKREKLLNDKTDMVSFYIDYIVEHYGGDVGND